MLLENDFRVVLHDNDEVALEEVLVTLGDLAKKESCYPICFDATDAGAVGEAVKRIEADFHPVYCLINNSGMLSSTPVAETELADWRQAFAQNVDAAFLVARALLPGMRKRRWGRIVNTCSLAGKTGGCVTGIAYATTKGALQTFTYALARECAKDGITVNGIAPAYVRTPAVEAYPKDMLPMLLEYIPVGRFCEPEEFANAVRFLIDPLAGFICGSIINMSGGLLMS